MAQMKHSVEVEKGQEGGDGEPSVGPAYRSVFAKDGFPPPIPGLESCWDVFRMSAERNPKNQMLGQREVVDGMPGEYVWLTYEEVYDIVLKLGVSIHSCGVEQGGRCGIYGANCPEWIISMEACNAYGVYCVPLYDTLGAGAIEFIICHAEIQIAFVEEKKIVEALKTFPNLTTIVSFGKVIPEQREEVEKFGLAIYSWDEFLHLGDNQQFDLLVRMKTDICTIMYSGGTIGDHKGVMICNESIFTLIAGVGWLLHCVKEHLHDDDVYLFYLPLAHIFDRVIEELFIFHGASIGFWHGDVKLLVEDIKDSRLKPTIFCVVPLVLDRIYAGLTETCAGTFVSLPNDFSMLGTVGPPVPNVDVHLESVPEMGYDALSSIPHGEICIRGKTLFSGYHKREDLTNEVMIDGWFHTGDIGEWQPDGSIKIIDRKKNIFKLSQGEYIAVDNLENIYSLISDIESIWIYGNSFESFLVAIVNPNKQALQHCAEENGKSGDYPALCENHRAREYILGELSKIARAKKVKVHNSVERF
ncbi:LOW QUALITY PROTEIN: long chain acyl-CoA synthetase 4 [Elaeis guineensis]|uniref:LOW QUALITY PROTEIN: long chain acyl-CoA synthetase 4 n=1 Tax=Elaeis guineensis var. tenera TaxID=51953 RepID=UPI003C6DA26A